MKKIIILLLISLPTFAQNYAEEINKFREDYRASFANNGSSPIKKEDIGFLRFYEPNEHFKVIANFKKAKKAKTLKIMTSSGNAREYQQFGEIFFKIDGKFCNLTLFRMIGVTMPEYADYLFLPFKDLTNGQESYGGGRYIDLKVGDIKNDKITIDFNKCYNPYCAFSTGYSCPIPPRSNHLNVAIEAGEKNFGKEH